MAQETSASPSLTRIRSSMSNFQFEIEYSKLKDLPVKKNIFFPTFTVGGYDWILEYRHDFQSNDVLFLRLRSEAIIEAIFSIKLLAKTGDTISYNKIGHFSRSVACGIFIDKHELKDLYLEKDLVLIFCEIRLIRVSSESKAVKNDPGGLFEDMEKLWDKKERFDVTFDVEGESISAHRIILATRSLVFQRILYGPMEEAKMECIKIDEMKAEVFKALLRFMYTDKLPLDESCEDKTSNVRLLQYLFVASDRYALKKLILLCEEQLVKNLCVDTVITTLVLAEQHSRVRLKKCLEFASDPENFFLVALTEGYLHVMSGYPSLVAELSHKVKSSSESAKKHRRSWG